MYIDIDKVKVFPSTKRDTESKLLSEKAMTRFINASNDVDSWILNPLDEFIAIRDYEFSEWGTNPLELIMKGYYFSIENADMLSVISSLGDTVYARIVIDITNTAYTELIGQDDSTTGKYNGINFVSTSLADDTTFVENSNQKTYELCILKDSKVPKESFQHLSSLGIVNVDGGLIE